jgi:integrase
VRALEFTILTAARTCEVTRAKRPGEIDSASATWTRPAEHMKGGKDHRVPLSVRALAIVRDQPKDEEHLFPGRRRGCGISENTMVSALGEVLGGQRTVTVHGFRSSFRDWAAESTDFASEVVEMALAHTIENETEAAYRRGDLFAKRRKLMDAWAAYREGPIEAKVISLRA